MTSGLRASTRTPLQHGGWKEGRDPNPFFDTDFYLTANPDVKAAGSPAAALPHHRLVEGRELPRFQFQRHDLLAQNPDVAAAHVDPLQHFLQTAGEPPVEPRQRPRVVDLRITANGLRLCVLPQPESGCRRVRQDAFFHFQNIGWKEGRDPNAYFDVKGYLSDQCRCGAAGINPLEFISYRRLQGGSNPSPWVRSGPSISPRHPDIKGANRRSGVALPEDGQAEGRVRSR